ncbi:MAG: hypothetical protein ACK4GG_03010 [Sphingomonas sp.]
MNKLSWIGGLVVAGAAFVAVPEAKANTQRNCAVDSVAVIDARMHIKCAPIPGVGHSYAIYYFAMNLSEGPAKVQSLIALAIAAKQARKPMVLWFDMEDYKSVPGCAGSNCRKLRGAAME